MNTDIPVNDIVKHLQSTCETYFDAEYHTIHIVGFGDHYQYNLYPFGTRPDDDGEFDSELVIDGSELNAQNALQAVNGAIFESEDFHSFHVA